jgi:hypothetical protein
MPGPCSVEQAKMQKNVVHDKPKIQERIVSYDRATGRVSPVGDQARMVRVQQEETVLLYVLGEAATIWDLRCETLPHAREGAPRSPTRLGICQHPLNARWRRLRMEPMLHVVVVLKLCSCPGQ